MWLAFPFIDARPAGILKGGCPEMFVAVQPVVKVRIFLKKRLRYCTGSGK
jgi:hypothetical protein